MDLHDAPSPTPSLQEYVDARLRGFALDLQVCCPAHVVTYADGRATIQLGRLPVLLDGTPEPPITIPGCPVAWPGSSVASSTWPLPPGSTGIALFADRALDRWLELGAPCDPVSGRAHSLDGAIFLPLVPTGEGAATPGAMVLDAPLVDLGAAASSFALHGTEVLAAITTWTGAITSAGTVWTAAAGGPPYAANLPSVSGAFIADVIAANTALVATLAQWISVKVRVE